MKGLGPFAVHAYSGLSIQSLLGNIWNLAMQGHGCREGLAIFTLFATDQQHLSSITQGLDLRWRALEEIPAGSFPSKHRS